MEKNELKRKNKNKKKRQIGRGGAKAKTAGRGTKGQNARAGRKKRPELRDFIKRFPKLRGRGVNSNKSIYKKPILINLSVLDKNFQDGEIVSAKALLDKGLVASIKGFVPEIKILSSGVISKKLKIKNIKLSETAKDKVLKALGEIL